MLDPFMRLIVAVHLGASRLATRVADSAERGQSTAEYAMVLGGIALLVAAVFTDHNIFKTLWDAAIKAIHIGGD